MDGNIVLRRDRRYHQISARLLGVTISFSAFPLRYRLSMSSWLVSSMIQPVFLDSSFYIYVYAYIYISAMADNTLFFSMFESRILSVGWNRAGKQANGTLDWRDTGRNCPVQRGVLSAKWRNIHCMEEKFHYCGTRDGIPSKRIRFRPFWKSGMSLRRILDVRAGPLSELGIPRQQQNRAGSLPRARARWDSSEGVIALCECTCYARAQVTMAYTRGEFADARGHLE